MATHPANLDPHSVEGSLDDAVSYLKTKCGKTFHKMTVSRWIKFGKRMKDGRTVKAEATKYPGEFRISPAAIDAFLDTLTADYFGERVPTACAKTTRQRSAANKRAEQELAKVGI